MDEILRQLSARLGIPLDLAESGAGALLSFIRENASQIDFQELLKSVPEAAAWMGRAPAAAGTADNTSGNASANTADIGGLLGQAMGILGGFGGSAAGILTTLSRLGLRPATALRFVPELLGLLQGKAGGDLIGRLAGSVPFLKDFLGGNRPS
jgi:hypothetical protein